MADNLTLALKIKADLKNALSNFKAVEIELQQTGRAGENVGNSANTSAQELERLGKSADNATTKLGKTRASFAKWRKKGN